VTAPVLDVDRLRVLLPGRDGTKLPAVDGVSFAVAPGEIVGVAGESGSGKTMTALALFGLLPHGATTEGALRFDGSDVLTMRAKDLRGLRGQSMSMVFQDPMTSLHPMLTVEKQITEHLRFHTGVGRRAARARALELLEQVRIPDPARTLGAYPHQFSGGMRQRVAIAVALACSPRLLIADEPTTALDVTVQAGILRLLDRLRREEGLAIVIITHDLGVMSSIADRVVVMYAGRVAESGPTAEVLGAPRHPYTRGLLDALPHPERGTTSLVPIAGAPPVLGGKPAGCAFHPRCAFAEARCRTDRPEALPVDDRRRLACWVDPFVADPVLSGKESA
jgi:oligopeptide transport system ATP-binding protein